MQSLKFFREQDFRWSKSLPAPRKAEAGGGKPAEETSPAAELEKPKVRAASASSVPGTEYWLP
jgi:hypothetical protein